METEKAMNKFKAILKYRLSKSDYRNQFFYLDLLETYINMYYKAKEEISKNGITFINKYGVVQKNPSVTILQTSAKHIEKIIKDLFLNLEKESVDSKEAEEFINNLVN